MSIVVKVGEYLHRDLKTALQGRWLLAKGGIGCLWFTGGRGWIGVGKVRDGEVELVMMGDRDCKREGWVVEMVEDGKLQGFESGIGTEVSEKGI